MVREMPREAYEDSFVEQFKSRQIFSFGQ